MLKHAFSQSPQNFSKTKGVLGVDFLLLGLIPDGIGQAQGPVKNSLSSKMTYRTRHKPLGGKQTEFFEVTLH